MIIDLRCVQRLCFHGFAYLLILLVAIGCKKTTNEIVFPVTLGEVTQQDVPIYIETIGNVYSLQTVLLRPQVGGIIQEVYVKQGQYVKKGQPLYKIDPRPYQANLERAKAALIKDTAALNFAENQANRYGEVVKKDFVSKLTYEQYVSQVDLNKGQILSDQADIALAELNLEWCVPVSPMDGKISQYNIDPGNLVIANDQNALTTIRQITPADIRFTITQKDFIEVQKALLEHQGHLKFEAILPQDPNQPREGNIYFIDNHIDQATGTILIKGTVPNEDEFLWPGEFIRVRLLLRYENKALLVPEEAVKVGQNGAYVYVYQEKTSTVDYKPVVKGPKIGHYIVINKGIDLKDKIILQGQNNLIPGAKVKIAKKTEIEKQGLL